MDSGKDIQQILQLVTKIIDGFNNEKYTVGVFLDLTKPFASLNISSY